MGNSVPGFRVVKINHCPPVPWPHIFVVFPWDSKPTSNCGTKLVWDFNLYYRLPAAAAFIWGENKQGRATAASLLAGAPGLSQERLEQFCPVLLCWAGSIRELTGVKSAVCRQVGHPPRPGPQACHVTTGSEHTKSSHTQRNNVLTHPQFNGAGLKHHCETFVFFETCFSSFQRSP